MGGYGHACSRTPILFSNSKVLACLVLRIAAEIGCYHPLRDVVAVPFDARSAFFFKNTDKLTVDQLIAEKKR